MGSFQNTFNDEQDTQLYNYIKSLDSQLMPLDKSEFLKLVFQFAEHLKIRHRFNKKNGTAGKDFYYNFMKRHPDLSLRSAESTSLQRAAGFNKGQVDRFFDKLTELMDKHSFNPSRIFNADETGISVVHKNHLKVITVKGKKQVGKLTSGERGRNVTVLLCINAAGDQFIPPLFVFPRIRINNNLTKDAPEGSLFDGQPSGWITKDGFLKWMKAFVARVSPTKESPVLLIVDGHASHKDLEVILFARSHNVHMLSLPPHTTHKLQPLDRVIMKPFKNAYNDACSVWMRKNKNLKIAFNDIAGLVACALTKVCRMELAQSAFACTGIYPLNRNIFTDLDFSSTLIEFSPEPPEAVHPLPHPSDSSSLRHSLQQPLASTSKDTVTSETLRSSSNPTRPTLNEFKSGTSSSKRNSDGTLLLTSRLTVSSETLPSSSKNPRPSLTELSSASLETTPSHMSDTCPLRKNSPGSSTSNLTVTSEILRSTYNQSTTSLTELSSAPLETTPSLSLLQKISPLASGMVRKLNMRKRRGDQSEVLTSSPYKLLLEEKSKKLAVRQNKSTAKQKPVKQIKTKKQGKRFASIKRSLNFSSIDEIRTNCIICGENFNEDWIQCILCKGWAHENCANLEGVGPFYKCDVCQTKGD